MIRISALLTCFNRKEKTLQCLHGLTAQALPDGVVIEIVLVDDGSSDGTAEAVLAEYPTTRVIRGDGSLYWCGGMREAWREATGSDPDHYLLLNDDTLLLPGALHTLLEIVGAPASRIIAVAAIRNPQTGKASYGGVKRKSGLVAASGKKEICDTFNANAVLIPRAVYQELGILHETYTHGMGDFDYGYAATRRGIRVIQSADFHGECERNAIAGSWRDRSLPRTARWKQLRGKKGLPFSEWMEYNRRNTGILWPFRTVSPYVKVLLGR